MEFDERVIREIGQEAYNQLVLEITMFPGIDAMAKVADLYRSIERLSGKDLLL